MIEVRSLVGKETLNLSLICLKTLLEKTKQKIHLVVHGDGSLSKRDKKKIESLGDNVKVIGRKKIEEKILKMISDYEMSLKYRRKNIFGIKLFDIILLSEKDAVHYVDSDIVFLKTCQNIFNLEDGVDASFSSNGRMNHAYSLRPLDVCPLGDIRVAKSVCAGLFSIRRERYDIDHIERVLGQLSDSGGKFSYRPFWVEQTCWASLALKINSRLWSFDNITIPKKGWLGENRKFVSPPKEKIGAIHFTSSTRDSTDDYSKWKSDESIQVESNEVSPAQPHDILISDVRRALKRAF
jgi:hypothetical protein